MDPRLIRRYSDELTYLRELGGEFAREFPKVASRLGLESLEVADPYVERLLEGFAFLSARLQMKLDAEHPRLAAHLLESLYPNFLAPLPAMGIAQWEVDAGSPNLLRGHQVPRGSAMISREAVGQGTHCEFRSAHDVRVWPIELAGVRYSTQNADLPLARLPEGRQVRSSLRLRLRVAAGLAWSRLPLDRLDVYIAAPDDIAFRLHELVLGHALGSWVNSASPGSEPAVAPHRDWAPAASIEARGFEPDEALLPESLRAYSGYRLLQEFAALPQRFLFFSLGGLRERLARRETGEIEIVILLDRAEPELVGEIGDDSLALNCTPVINLFPRKLDRLRVSPGEWEHHVVPDRTRPMDFEVHSLLSVQGHGTGPVAQPRFTPLYATWAGAELGQDGHYSLRREARAISARQQRQGPRTGYLGEEVFLSLVDPRHAPYAADLRQLSIEARVSNRDLPVLLPAGGAWSSEAGAPVTGVRLLRGPTRPAARETTGGPGWQLVRLLGLQHLDLSEGRPAEAAGALREVLRLFGPAQDPTWARLVEGVQALSLRHTVRRLPHAGPLTFGRGLEYTLEVDEPACAGRSAFLLGLVLGRFVEGHAGLNCSTQMVLRTPQRGEVHRGAARLGTAVQA